MIIFASIDCFLFCNGNWSIFISQKESHCSIPKKREKNIISYHTRLRENDDLIKAVALLNLFLTLGFSQLSLGWVVLQRFARKNNASYLNFIMVSPPFFCV